MVAQPSVKSSKRTIGLCAIVASLMLVPAVAVAAPGQDFWHPRDPYYISDDLRQFFSTISPYRAAPLTKNDCRQIQAPKLEGCEDIVINHRSGRAFMACGNVLTRRMMDDQGKAHPNDTNAVFTYDIKNDQLQEMQVEGLPAKALHLLGIGIWDQAAEHAKFPQRVPKPADPEVIRMFAVNIRTNDSSIEVFEHKLGTTVLKHARTITHPLIVSPNSVHPVSADSFYVSNDMHNRDKVGRAFETMTSRRWGSIIYYAPSGRATKVVKNMGYANGIGTNYDGSRVYISSSMGRVHVYRRNRDNSLTELAEVPVGPLSDNLRVNPEDGSVLVAGNARYLEFMFGMKIPNFVSHGVVSRVTNATMEEYVNGQPKPPKKIDPSGPINPEDLVEPKAAAYGHGKEKYKSEVVYGEYALQSTMMSVADYSPAHKKMLIGSLIGKGFLVCNTDLKNIEIIREK